MVEADHPEQLRLSFAELTDEVAICEHAVRVTSLSHEILTFNALKNH